MRTAILTLTLLLGTGVCLIAQDLLTGKPFTGFKVPEVDAEGNLKWNLRGESGLMRSQELVELKGVTVDFYRDKKVDMTVTTPFCIYQRTQKHVETDQPVQIVAANFIITGTGMNWDSKDNVVHLLHGVKIILPSKYTAQAVRGNESGIK